MSAVLGPRQGVVNQLHGETVAAAIVCRKRDRSGPLAVSDLSASRATLTGTMPALEVGCAVRILLQLEGRRRPIRLDARVISVMGNAVETRCHVCFVHRVAATEELLQRAALTHLERLHSRLSPVMVLDSGRLIRSDLGRDLLTLGYNPLFFRTMLDAVWWAEKFATRCSAVLVDSAFLAHSRESVLEFLSEYLPRVRRLLVVPGVQELPRDLFGSVHAIIETPIRASDLGTALSPLRTTLFARRRILFVDDEPKVLAGLQGRLRRDLRDWHSVWTTSGEAALSEFRAAPFDVVVTDVRMPGMDGIELLAAIKEMHPPVRRIVLSGYELPSSNSVADVVLRKPCPMSVLREAALQFAGRMDP